MERTQGRGATAIYIAMAVLLAMAVMLGLAANGTASRTHDAAAGTGQTAEVASAGEAAGSPLPTRAVDAGEIKLAGSYNSYGCVGMLNAKQMHVLAFVAGFCPSTWVLQSTPWGRSMVNHVVNVACKAPWIVRAATGGKSSSC